MGKFHWQAIVAGVGGQGVLFVTRMLAGAARQKGGKVLISEVHGMAQRGGSVVSHLKAGDFASPLVTAGQAQLLFSLDAGEAVRNLAYLARGGTLVVNAPGADFLSPAGKAALTRFGVRLICRDAGGLAQRAGAPKAANVVLLAAAAAQGALPFSREQVWDILYRASPPARREANRRLFELGAGQPAG